SLLRQSGGGFAVETSPAKQLVSPSAVAPSLCPRGIYNAGLFVFLVTYLARPAAIYVNTTKSVGHWLGVRLLEPRLGGRDAIGAQVTLVSGELRQNRWLFGGGSYQCVSDLRLHFGLGARDRYDAIH